LMNPGIAAGFAPSAIGRDFARFATKVPLKARRAPSGRRRASCKTF
jgi:hypothetical protein